jgi:hypothetical protein
MMAGLGLGVDGLLYKMDNTALEFLNLKEKDIISIMAELVESVTEVTGSSG